MAQLQTTAVTGSLTVTGQIIAQTLNVQQVTSSIIYSSGSNRFGNLVTDVQQFTGSLRVTGSGAHYIVGGNVGINTTSPVSTLSVIGPDASTHTLSWANQNRNIGYLYSDGGGVGMYVGALANAGIYLIENSRIDFRVSGSERVRIDSTGNVGIGTISPTHMLDILTNKTGNGAGSTVRLNRPDNASYENAINWATNGNNIWFLGSDNNSTDNFYLYNWRRSAFELTILSGSGFVGINTSSPAYTLDVIGNGRFNTTAQPILLLNSSNASGGYLGLQKSSTDILYIGPSSVISGIGTNVDIWSTSGNGLSLYTNGATTNVLHISTSGNVGIGTTTPIGKLQVAGTSGNLLTVGTLTNNWAGDVAIGVTNGNGVIISKINTANDTNRVLVFYRDDTNGATIWGYTPTGGSGNVGFQIRANASSYFNGGNVGIGTTAPAYTLDVIGASRFGQSSTVILSNDGTYGTGYGTVAFGGNTNGFNRVFGSTGTADGLFLASATGRGIFFRPNGAAIDRVYVSPSGSFIVGDTVVPSEGAWFGTAVFGKNSTNKVIAGYLVSSTNGAVIGGHNSALTAWADLNIAGINLIFRSSETEYMRLASTGNVGIGTTAPSTKLHVYGSSDQALFVENAATYQLYAGISSNIGFVGSNNNTPLSFRTAGSTRMYITTGGNVGIGVTTPAARLQVSGSSNVLSVVGSGSLSTSSLFSVDGAFGRLFEVTDDLSNSLFSVNTIAGLPVIEAFADYSVNLGTYSAASGSTMRITGSSVGIGTTNPAMNLQIDSTGFSFRLRERSDGSSLVLSGNQIQARTSANGGSALYLNFTNGGEIYTGAGNVGIGTTSTTRKLTVWQTIDGQYGQYIYHGGTNGSSYGLLIDAGSTSVDAGLRVRSKAGTDYFIIKGDGNVGIGTTLPSRVLYVSSSVWDNTAGAGVIFDNSSTVGAGLTLKPNASVVTNGSSGWAMYAGGPGAAIGDGNLGFWAHGTNQARLLIQRDGNVGIGTTTTANTLHVHGTSDGLGYIRITDSVTGATSTDGVRIGYNSGVLRLQNYENSDIQFLTNNTTEAIRIKSDGNVGIGTTAPATPLHVQGGLAGTGGWNRTATLAATYPALIFNSNGTKWGGIAYDYSAGMRFWVNANNDDIFATSNVLSILNNGNVGIGASAPTNTLQVVGGVTALSFTGSLQGTASYATQALSASYAPGGASQWTTTGNNIYYTTGNVGIGTSTIARKLDIYGDGTLVRLQSPTANQFAELEFTANGAGSAYIFKNSAGYLPYGGTGSLNIYNTGNIGFHSEATFHIMTLLRGGNVGIGSNAPTQKLDVAGSVNISSGAYYKGGALNIVGSDGTSNYINTGAVLYIQNGGSTLAVVNSNGSVGIGTTSPGRKLTVRDPSAYMSFAASSYGTHTIGSDVFGFIVYDDGVGGGYRMVISGSSGLVGIGTTAPLYKLDVAGDIRTTSNMYLPSGGTLDWGNGDARIIEGSTTNYSLSFNLYNATAGGLLNRLFLQTDGNIGIGTTSPAYRLDVSGSSRFIFRNTSNEITDLLLTNEAANSKSKLSFLWYGNETAAIKFTRGGDATGGGIELWTQATGGSTLQRVTILDTGNVGIGTTSPTYKLHVSGGNAFFDGIIVGLDTTYGAPYRVVGFNSTSDGGNRILASSTTSDGMYFMASTGNGFKFRPNGGTSDLITITSAGSIGVGTTAPAVNLQVVGNARFGANSSVATSYIVDVTAGNASQNAVTDYGFFSTFDTGIWYVGYFGADGGQFKIKNASAGPIYDRFVIDNTGPTITFPSGAVGIGTTSVSARFEIKSSATNNLGGLLLRATSTANFPAVLYENSSNGGTLDLYNAAALNTRINSNGASYFNGGSVGIGTTAPGYILDVVGQTRIQGNTTNGPLLVNGGDSNASFVRSSIAFGFNATDGYYHWIHTRHNGGTPAGNALDFYTSDGTQNGTFPTNGVHGLTISAGSVGINTTSPATTLHVQGTATVSGSLRLSGSAIGIPEHMIVAISDETTNLTTGTGKMTMRAPFAMRLTELPRASLTTASTSGLVTVDINEAGTSVLGANKLSIDANELTSTTAATPTTIADALIADDAQIRFDIDAAGTGARGLKVTLYYIRI